MSRDRDKLSEHFDHCVSAALCGIVVMLASPIAVFIISSWAGLLQAIAGILIAVVFWFLSWRDLEL